MFFSTAYFRKDYIFSLGNNLAMFKLIGSIITISNLCLTTFCFYVGVKNGKKHRELSHLFIYTIASILQTVLIKSLDIISKVHPIPRLSTYCKISIQMFILTEFLCIYFFFYKVSFFNNRIKKILLASSILFFMFYVTSFSNLSYVSNMSYLYNFESLIILLPCFVYLYQLFLNPPILNLLQEPSFWFTSGVLIYFVLTLPLFIIVDNLNDHYFTAVVNMINLIGYMIIFSFLIKAYRCRPNTVR